MRLRVFLVVVFAAVSFYGSAGNKSNYCAIGETHSISGDSTRLSDSLVRVGPDDLKILKRKKRLAAILSFPLPFGIVGLHRIHLETKPYVPFVYVGTLGGCLGVIPLIDFIMILSTPPEKLQKFEKHPGVFMWMR